MTVQAYARDIPIRMNHRVQLFSWAALANGDEGAAVEQGHFADRSVQVSGDLGGGKVTMLGSINSTNGTDGDWHTLHDPYGNLLEFSAGGIEAVSDLVRWIKPALVGATGGAAIVSLLLKN